MHPPPTRDWDSSWSLGSYCSLEMEFPLVPENHVSYASVCNLEPSIFLTDDDHYLWQERSSQVITRHGCRQAGNPISHRPALPALPRAAATDKAPWALSGLGVRLRALCEILPSKLRFEFLKVLCV